MRSPAVTVYIGVMGGFNDTLSRYKSSVRVQYKSRPRDNHAPPLHQSRAGIALRLNNEDKPCSSGDNNKETHLSKDKKKWEKR